MRNPEELNDEERFLILRILKEMPHQMPDYSDVYVGNILHVQMVTNQAWMPKGCYAVPHNVQMLLNDYCEYGFIEPTDKIGAYKITRFGVEYLRLNANL